MRLSINRWIERCIRFYICNIVFFRIMYASSCWLLWGLLNSTSPINTECLTLPIQYRWNATAAWGWPTAIIYFWIADLILKQSLHERKHIYALLLALKRPTRFKWCWFYFEIGSLLYRNGSWMFISRDMHPPFENKELRMWYGNRFKNQKRTSYMGISEDDCVVNEWFNCLLNSERFCD